LGWSKNIKFKLAKTLSKNLVYEISDLNHKALFKLLSDKETLPSKRLISLYKYLEQNTKIPVPKIFYFDDSRIFFNKDVVVQDYVKGGVQTNCIRKHPSDLSNLFMQIERAVSEIHRINPTEVKDFWYPNDWNQPRKVVWQKYLIEEIGLTLLWLPNFDLEIEQKLAAAKKLNALVKRIKEEEIVPVPLHGDLSPPNIIIDHAAGECKLVRIVDFERARMGDAVWDLVYYYGFLERLNENVANQWKKIVWEKLDPDAKSRFDEYRFVFHAWTVRDMIDMPEEISRTKAGKKSLAILRTDCLQIA
jgi:thiamine kinase-like enzyme